MKVIATNRRARHDITITDTYECGIVLTGAEVKSIRAGHVSLKGSYVTQKGHDLYLIGATITPYKFAAQANYEPTADRKLLLHRREIDEIVGSSSARGGVAVPLAIGLSHNLIKLEIGVGRGKRAYDKREVVKKRIMLREAAREQKSR